MPINKCSERRINMPNHVRNVLKFKNLKPKDKEFILNNFTTEMEDEITPFNKIFDFDKIIPEPKIESECPEDCKVNKDSHVEEDADRPWFDWYTWHNKYWGTKWGAYDGYVKIGTSKITFVFSTAWSAPFPIYRKLAEDYPFRFQVRYADEDIGSNCGIIEYDPDVKYPVDPYSELYEQDAAEDTVSFARRIWNNY